METFYNHVFLIHSHLQNVFSIEFTYSFCVVRLFPKECLKLDFTGDIGVLEWFEINSILCREFRVSFFRWITYSSPERKQQYIEKKNGFINILNISKETDHILANYFPFAWTRLYLISPTTKMFSLRTAMDEALDWRWGEVVRIMIILALIILKDLADYERYFADILNNKSHCLLKQTNDLDELPSYLRSRTAISGIRQALTCNVRFLISIKIRGQEYKNKTINAFNFSVFL